MLTVGTASTPICHNWSHSSDGVNFNSIFRKNQYWQWRSTIRRDCTQQGISRRRKISSNFWLKFFWWWCWLWLKWRICNYFRKHRQEYQYFRNQRKFFPIRTNRREICMMDEDEVKTLKTAINFNDISGLVGLRNLIAWAAAQSQKCDSEFVERYNDWDRVWSKADEATVVEFRKLSSLIVGVPLKRDANNTIMVFESTLRKHVEIVFIRFFTEAVDFQCTRWKLIFATINIQGNWDRKLRKFSHSALQRLGIGWESIVSGIVHLDVDTR